MAPSRSNRLRYTPLRSRRTSLQECLDSRPLERKRKCYKNIVSGFLLIIVLHYSYTYYAFSEEFELPDNVDEYLTTRGPDEEAENPAFGYKLEYHVKYGANTTLKQRRLLPRCIKSLLHGRIHLNTSRISLADLEDEYPMVFDGGFHFPQNCTTRQEVAIIVAYRDRPTNLAIFLYNMHRILMAQQLEYQIFIIEQAGDDLFNKGRLFNVGFKEVVKLKKFQCMVFHDLDLLPLFWEIQYTCPTLPRHMSSFIDHSLVMKLKYLSQPYKYKSLFGGVVSLTVEMFERANGYSNLYFGWGGEDNDMFWRLRAAGYPVVRYNKTIGVYTVLPHIRAPINKFRHYLLVRAVERYKVDGLSNLEYVVVSNKSHHLFTHLMVDVNPRKENITILTRKWASGDNAF